MAILSVIILAGIIVHLKMYTMNRSFHLDEAMFAESILTRSFFNLASVPLLNDQTAPILYLYAVKLMSLALGPTETALRIFSLFTFFGVLVITGILLKSAFKIKNVWTLLGICIISTLGIYMRYSIELKPYMSDAFFIMGILLVYRLYNTGKTKLFILTLLCCIAILFSSPALFFVASIYIFECIRAVKNKDWKYTRKIIIAGITVLVCFIIYYVLWLIPVAESSYMIDFWKDHRFYLFPIKKEYLVSDILNIARIFRRFGFLFFLYPVLFLAGLIISLRQKNHITCVTGLSACLLLIASQIEKYPMDPRLYMFVYALIVAYSIICINYFSTRYSNKIKILCVIYALSAILVLNTIDFTQYAIDRVYIDTHEVNPLIEYVRENIQDGEYLYSSATSNYVLRFKNGYNTNRIGNVSYDNIIYGGAYDDTDRVLAAQKAYLLFQQKPSIAFLEELEAAGYLHEVSNYYQTPLYYFSTDSADPGLHRTFEGRDFRDDITIILRFAIKGIIEVSVKSDDATDKLIIYINTYKRGEVMPHEYSINRP
jgi:hypothetical protein